jgi:hypothetical protein
MKVQEYHDYIIEMCLKQVAPIFEKSMNEATPQQLLDFACLQIENPPTDEQIRRWAFMWIGGMMIQAARRKLTEPKK